MPGGAGVDGTTNVVVTGGADLSTSLDPTIVDYDTGVFAPGSDLADVDGKPGYPIDFGTSFLLALAFHKDGPVAKAFLTYGNTDDHDSTLFTQSTERFAAKKWRDVDFAEADVRADTTSVLTVRG